MHKEIVYNPNLKLPQQAMQIHAQDRISEKYRAFNEIMTGPNPLTKDEIRKLVEKRPAFYAFLRAWL